MWYIGQRIVAIADHEQKVFKKGDEFTLLSIKYCKCSQIILEIRVNCTNTVCHSCRVEHESTFFHEKRFKPLQEISDFTFEDAMEFIKTKRNFLYKI